MWFNIWIEVHWKFCYVSNNAYNSPLAYGNNTPLLDFYTINKPKDRLWINLKIVYEANRLKDCLLRYRHFRKQLHCFVANNSWHCLLRYIILELYCLVANNLWHCLLRCRHFRKQLHCLVANNLWHCLLRYRHFRKLLHCLAAKNCFYCLLRYRNFRRKYCKRNS